MCPPWSKYTNRRPIDGHGWYILEGDEGARSLRDPVRYNLKEAAISQAGRFRGETLSVGWWDGQWSQIERVT